MRRSVVSENYRTLYSGVGSFPLHSVYVEDQANLGNFLLDIAPGITVLCGPSGVGKTRFLTALDRHMNGDNTVSMAVQVNDIFDDHSTLSQDILRRRSSCRYIDTAAECSIIRSHVTADSGLADKRDGAEVAVFNHDSLSHLRYIMGREYESASFQELDREDGVPGQWRYFELAYRGVTYGPGDMSLGELAALTVLAELSAAKKGRVLLLDEPENFLSPRSRSHLIDVMTAHVIDRRLSMVVASHSVEFIERIPVASVRVMSRLASGVSIDTIAHESPALAALGIAARPKVLAVVEDNLAADMLRGVLALAAPQLRGEVAIVQVGGDGKVASVTEALRKCSLGMATIGVLDGDSRSKVEDGIIKIHPSHVTYLPGDCPPETLVIKALWDNSTVIAARLGVTSEQLSKALTFVEGLDHHDQPDGVSNMLGTSSAHLVETALRTLVSNEPGSTEANELVEMVSKLLSA